MLAINQDEWNDKSAQVCSNIWIGSKYTYELSGFKLALKCNRKFTDPFPKSRFYFSLFVFMHEKFDEMARFS